MTGFMLIHFDFDTMVLKITMLKYAHESHLLTRLFGGPASTHLSRGKAGLRLRRWTSWTLRALCVTCPVASFATLLASVDFSFNSFSFFRLSSMLRLETLSL